MATRANIPRWPASARLLILGLGLALPCVAAHADDDPFDISNSHWMSFDHYKDAAKRGNLPKPPPVAESATPEQTGQNPPGPAAEATPATPALATPSRPVDLPIMPGMNKGFNVHITSTEDDKATSAATAAPVITADAPPDIHLSDKNWQQPVSALHLRRNEKNEMEAEDDENAPLDIRQSYLPNAKITPVPSPEAAGPSGQSLTRALTLKREQQRQKQAAANPKTQAEKAACAAIDAYKKQQLNALQSDRETLKALQDAISALGLQKELSFMGGGNGLSASDQSPKTDTPLAGSTTTVR